MTMRGRGSIGFFGSTVKAMPSQNERINKLNSGSKMINLDDDLNDISVILRPQNQEGGLNQVDSNQFMDEESFNQELLLMKLEG